MAVNSEIMKAGGAKGSARRAGQVHCRSSRKGLVVRLSGPALRRGIITRLERRLGVPLLNLATAGDEVGYIRHPAPGARVMAQRAASGESRVQRFRRMSFTID